MHNAELYNALVRTHCSTQSLAADTGRIGILYNIIIIAASSYPAPASGVARHLRRGRAVWRAGGGGGGACYIISK